MKMNPTEFKKTEIGTIPSSWEVETLSDIIKIIGGGTPKTNIKEYWGGNIPWISVNDFVGDQRYITNTEKQITEKGVAESATKLLQKGQLIISARGTVGEIGQVRKSMAFNQSCYGLDAKDKSNNDFLYYLLRFKIKDFQARTHGSVFNTITRKTFEQIKIVLPPLPEQKAIAKVLSDLDAKIELNHRMNKTLESIGQAIFKRWFVDFEFPDEHGRPYKSSGGPMIDSHSEFGMIPEGWEVGNVGKEISVKGGTTPSTKKDEYWKNGDIAWCTPKDLSKLSSPVLLDTERKITIKGLSTISSGLLSKGTLLLSSRAPIGYTALAEIPTSINQGFIAIICDKHLSNLFMMYWVKQNLSVIKNMAGGSTFQEINKTSFRQIKIVVPDIDVVNSFNKLTKNLYKRIVINEKEKLCLSQIRDSLLPRLMSGKIRVKVAKE